MMNMKHATTTVNGTVMRKKTGLLATGNQKETRVRKEMTATVREINIDIDRATGLMTRHEVTDQLTESVGRPRSVIEPIKAATEIEMMTEIDIVASIKIVGMKGNVSGLDQGTDLHIANMKSLLEVDTSKSVVAVIGKSNNFNFVLHNCIVCILIGTDLTAIRQAVTTLTIIEVTLSDVTKEVVTGEVAESMIVVRTMIKGSDVRETLRMIWPLIPTFRKRILTTEAATITSSKEKARKVKATYFGTASNGCLANVKRPISTQCKST